ncbi:MAG TPA: 2Fe-2S iron-sulfur cluster-binding protein [Phycisphaerae bacterium]|nr:2Fe-2S iron-sulfur cluster-binding protein [Phycisphaerae bacterium]HNU45604.1 2Fe-2S iron-sulfur cluster-binding protein [Phycisphaerae bacterium]
MGGINPYIRQTEVARPMRRYRITFLPINVAVEVDPERIPYSAEGLPGSILEIALAHGVELDHACGGVCACSTCHCLVREGSRSLPEPSDAELDQLDNAPGVGPQSRLACQSVPDGTCDLVVEVPEWNRNLIQEGKREEARGKREEAGGR